MKKSANLSPMQSSSGPTLDISEFGSAGGIGRTSSFGIGHMVVGPGSAQGGMVHPPGSDGDVRGSREYKGKKSGFKDWKRRVGEKAIQKIGLAAPSRDENTGDIEVPLQAFTQMKEGLREIQTQVRTYVMATEALFLAADNMTFLSAPLSGETAKQVRLSLCRGAIRDALIRGLTEYLEAPLRAALDFCEHVDTLAKRRNSLLLDYDHHKRKHEATAARRDAGKGDVEEEVRSRSAKLNHSIEELKSCTTEVLAEIGALAKASLAAFDNVFVASADMQDYIMSLQRASTTMEQSLPLPPPGEHVTYLQNALAAAAAEARREGGGGEVFGRPLSDFDHPPPVLLECMGFLDANGLYVPGLFRVPGNTETITSLKAEFDRGEHVEFNEEAHNVHDVATLLKMFFRELPDPVVPPAHYHTMLDASLKGTEEFVEAARACVSLFPHINTICIRLLLAFLFRVNLCSADNKMTTENLGIVFAPNLLRAPNATEISVMDLQACINLVKRMIESAERIFPNLWKGYPAAASG